MNDPGTSFLFLFAPVRHSGASCHLRGAFLATSRASAGVPVGHLFRKRRRAAKVAGQVNFLIPK